MCAYTVYIYYVYINTNTLLHNDYDYYTNNLCLDTLLQIFLHFNFNILFQMFAYIYIYIYIYI